MNKKSTRQVGSSNVKDSSERNYNFDEIYKAVTHMLVHGTKEQQNKAWKMLNEGKGDWVWMKMKVITDAYSHADAKGKEEFTLIAIEQHLKSGNMVLLKETFTDPETDVRYRLYKRKNGLIERVPFATDGMDKYTYDKALNKKFLGDYIEMSSVDEVTLIPLDTPEKVEDYNKGGGYYQNHPLYKDTKPIIIKLTEQKQEQSKVDSPQK